VHPRGVILDLDGTLIDTAGEIEAALSRTLAELSLAALPRKSVEALIGRGVRSLVERALAQLGSAADVDDAAQRFEAHYEDTVGTHAQLFEGAFRGLERMQGMGLPLAVVTNKPRFFTERLLARTGVLEFFTAVMAGDDGIAKKPAPDMLLEAARIMGVPIEATLMLGDSDNDVVAARAAGCAVWCVPYGYNEGRAPETLRCDRLVATLDEAAANLGTMA
jgi:phosphoglycolate phosphatase